MPCSNSDNFVQFNSNPSASSVAYSFGVHRTMPIRSYLFSLILGLAFTNVAFTNEDAIESDFVSIFNGKTLDGWDGDIKTFRVAEGMIIAGSLNDRIPNNQSLCSKKTYGDFELRLEARIRGEGKTAGILFRGQRIPSQQNVIGYQFQLGVEENKPIWGALYDQSRRDKFLAKGDAGKLSSIIKPMSWNDVVIRCIGPRIEMWVNGMQTVDYTEAESQIDRSGFLGLQIHAGPATEAYYRKIRIKRFGSAETIATEEAQTIAPEKLAFVKPSGKDFQLIFAGDIMLADLPGQAIARDIDPFAEFSEMLRGADATIGNLECVVATKGQAVKKPWVFRADVKVLPLLKKHFGIVSLANNHTGDFGHDAFLEQLDLMEKQQIAYFGGGRNIAHARMPHILNIKGLRVALLGYNEFKPRSFEAGPDWPGVAWSVDEQVIADIHAARTRHRADLVIPYMHWGWENEPANDRQKQLARLMIEAGADMVIGGHPHVTQEVEYYQGKLIVYSLGNFVFDGFEEGPSRIGWLVRLRMNESGLVAWDTVVAHMDKEGIPHLEREAKSPSGIAGSEKIEQRQGLIDSPLSTLRLP